MVSVRFDFEVPDNKFDHNIFAYALSVATGLTVDLEFDDGAVVYHKGLITLLPPKSDKELKCWKSGSIKDNMLTIIAWAYETAKPTGLYKLMLAARPKCRYCESIMYFNGSYGFLAMNSSSDYIWAQAVDLFCDKCNSDMSASFAIRTNLLKKSYDEYVQVNKEGADSV